MNWNELFKMESLQQRKEKEEAYFNKMYPFGQQQQKWEDETLESLFPQVKKKNIANIKYLLLIYREELMNTKETDTLKESFCKFFDSQIRHLKLNDVQKNMIKVMAELENKSESIENMPSIEEISK